MLVVLLAEGKHFFFSRSGLGQEIKINTRISLVFGKYSIWYTCPKLGTVVKGIGGKGKELGVQS